MSLDEPLHTDTSDNPANLTAEEYLTLHRLRAETLGDDGLHVVPQEYLDAIEAEHGADR